MVGMSGKKETLEGKLEELQEEYSGTKYNKATNKHLGILRRKIADVKKEIVEAGKHKKGEGFFVKKMGDATVALVGFPSAGKSSLINKIANTRSKTAHYAFTTTTIVPGTMLYKDAHIQVFDMPGLIEGAHVGLGGGRAVISAMKVADLIVFVIDVNNVPQLHMLMDELRALNVRINMQRPRLSVIETDSNTNIIMEVNKSGLSERDIIMVLNNFGIHNAKVRVQERIDIDDFIAIVTGKIYYMKAIVALNKIDTNKNYQKLADEISSKHGIKVIPISATEGTNIDRLKDEIYRALDIMTIYLKPKVGDERLMPMVLEKGSDVGDAARRLHTEIVDELQCAYVTGPSARFEHQRVGAAHVLKEGDIVTFIKNK
ncbi:MAG: 50S ribosome-binding GTPase [Candidatus Micrarchaeota archaeon]|nr:50S ribosome-binding GTPase [Candidatus Micrarchaeota archaeon]